MDGLISGKYFLEAHELINKCKSPDWDILWSDEKFHDVIFEVGSKPNQETFGCVRAVLALNSTVFKSMLFGGEEKRAEGERQLKRRCVITQVDPEPFRLLLQFLRTAQVEITEEVVIPLVDCARKFEVPLLEYNCLMFAQQKVCLENVSGLLAEAEEIGHTDLSEYFRSYIQRCVRQFFRDDKIKYLSYDNLLYLLKEDGFLPKNVPEKLIFDCCMKWAEYKCEETMKTKTLKNKKAILSEIMNAIDFCRMSFEELGNYIHPSGIFTEKKMFKLFLRKSSHSYSDRKYRRRGFQNLDRASPDKLHPVADILKIPEISDVTFIFPEEKEEVPSCRAVMATCCEYFAAMFYNDGLAESQLGINPTIRNFSPAAFKSMLNLLVHRGIDEQLTQNDVMNLIEMGAYYGLDEGYISKLPFLASHRIRLDLTDGLDCINVCRLFTLGIRINVEWIVSCCEKYMYSNVRSLYESKCHGLSAEALDHLLIDDNLLYPLQETEVFDLCLEWSKQRCNEEKLTPNGENCRTFLKDLICHIRFPVMDSTEFSSIVYDSGILTKDELIEILLYFGSNASRDIPYKKDHRTANLEKFRIVPTKSAKGEPWELSMSSSYDGPQNTYESLVDGNTRSGAGTNNGSNEYIMATFKESVVVSSVSLSCPIGMAHSSCGPRPVETRRSQIKRWQEKFNAFWRQTNGSTIQCYVDYGWKTVAAVSGVRDNSVKRFSFGAVKTLKVKLQKNSGSLATGHFIIK